MSVPLVKRRFTVDEYHRMAEAGILSEDDRVELLNGEIVEMVPIGARHAACVKRLNQLLSRQLGQHALVGVQDPIRVGEHSEPQPDLAVLRPRPDFYVSGHPGPEDILLVIEVSETSGGPDREVKIPLYARAGIPEAWLVDLQAEVVEVHRRPSPEGYREVHQARRNENLAPEAFPELTLSVDEILP